MIFLFCSVYSTCRCPFFFAKLLPGRMVKYRHANRRGMSQLSEIKDLGISLTSSGWSPIALIPQSFDARKISSRQEEPKGFKRREEKQVEQIISLRMELHRLSENEQGSVQCFSRLKRSHGLTVAAEGRRAMPLQMTIAIYQRKGQGGVRLVPFATPCQRRSKRSL